MASAQNRASDAVGGKDDDLVMNRGDHQRVSFGFEVQVGSGQPATRY